MPMRSPMRLTDTAIVQPQAALPRISPKAALPTAQPNRSVPEVTANPIQRFFDLKARRAR